MKQFITRRFCYSLLSLLVLSVTIFMFVRVTGDPASLLVEPGASEADIAAIHQKFGLDRPLWEQYGLFMVSLFRGDLGQSFYYQTPVFDLYLDRLPNSLLLAMVAMGFSLIVGIPSGILAAVNVGRFWDSFGKMFTLLGLSLPSFFVGLVLILLFSVYLGWLPSSGAGGPLHLIMPAFALGWYFAAAHMRMTRSSMLEVLGSEYVKLARLKGLPQALGDRQACLQECADPGAHPGRDQSRADDQCRRRGGDGIRLARDRAVALRRHQLPRFPGGAGRRDHGRRHDYRGEPAGRCRLCRDRSSHSSGEVTDMSTSIETITLPPQLTPTTATSRRSDFPMIPVVILGVIAFTAIFAEFLAPHNPEVGSLTARFHPPFWQQGGSMDHLLGTDQLGRDVLSRLIFGARVSMVVGFTAVIFAGIVGTVLGILAGYLGGWVDQVVMRITDAWLALPALTFAIFLAAIVGPSMWNIVIILGAVYWTRYARVVRGEVLSLKEREFVRLAIVAGCSKWTIMRRHILPNVVNSAIVLATLMLGVVIVAEASLSFLGVGVPPPQPAWGLMLSDGKQGLMVGYWWLTIFPGICIMLMVLSSNLLGDWLRVKLDPQLRQL